MFVSNYIIRQITEVVYRCLFIDYKLVMYCISYDSELILGLRYLG